MQKIDFVERIARICSVMGGSQDEIKDFIPLGISILMKPEIDYDELLKLVCLKLDVQHWNTTEEEIAKTVEDGIWADYTKASVWLEKLSALFEPGLKERNSGSTAIGIVLAVLRAHNRKTKIGVNLDKDCMEKTKQILSRAIANKNSMLEFAMSDVAYEDSAKRHKQQVCAKISEAVKAFIAGPHPHGSSSRENEGKDIVKQALALIEQRRGELSYGTMMRSHNLRPTALGTFLGEQFAFAVFAKMDVISRIRAISSVADER